MLSGFISQVLASPTVMAILGEVIISVPLDKFQTPSEVLVKGEEAKSAMEVHSHGPIHGPIHGRDERDAKETRNRRRKVARGFQLELPAIEVSLNAKSENQFQ